MGRSFKSGSQLFPAELFFLKDSPKGLVDRTEKGKVVKNHRSYLCQGKALVLGLRAH